MKKENPLIGRYQVLHEKNGIVVARDTSTDWLEQLIKLPIRWGGQKAAFQVLVQDLKGAMSLQNENAQTVDDAFEYKRAYYLALRYVEAAPLEKILRELKALSIDEVKRLANQVGGALISAHGLGVVHGHLELKNLMVNKDGDYVLTGFTDLPLAKYKKTPLKYKVGAAPELLAGEQASFASDQYSLAKLLKNLIERAKKAVDFKKSDLSQGMVTAVNKALNNNPNERYTDVNAFMRAFNNGAQANKNSTNAARNQAASNSRKQDRPMDYSEIPPSYLPSGSLTSGAESALSQAISSSAQNPYAMWSGVSPIEVQSQAPTLRVGAQSPQIVVEDFEINPGKSSNVEKDLSMRNIPKYKPAFDVDLSGSGSKSADAVFPFDDEPSPTSPHKDRMHTFVLALGMVIIILVGVTVALLGGNTPVIKLPGSKDVSANFELNGVMQSTLAKGAFPTATPKLISIVPIATQFPGLQTEDYNGTGGGLNLSPTPTATITQTPSPTNTQAATPAPELEVPGAFATAPANTGFFWDLVIEDPNETTQASINLDGVGGQGPEIDSPVPETAVPAVAEETPIPEPSSDDWVPVAPSPDPFYWDIVIDFPSPLEPAAPTAVSATGELTAPSETLGANLQSQVAGILPAPSATPEPILYTVTTDGSSAESAIQTNQGGSQANLTLATVVAPKPTPIPMQAGSAGSASDLQFVSDVKPNLVVTVVDGLGRPVADREVMVLPISEPSSLAIDTPLFNTPAPESVIPMLPFIDGVLPDLGGGIGMTDAFGQIHFDLDPGSFQVVYVPSGQVSDSDLMAHYQVEVAAGSKTELTLHRELVTVDFVNVEGEKVEIPGLGLLRSDSQGQISNQDGKSAIIPLNPETGKLASIELNTPEAEFGNGGSEPTSFPVFDLTPGEFELVQISQDGQNYQSLGIAVNVPQGQTGPIEIPLGRLVLPAAFLERDGKVGDTLQVIQQVTASGMPSQTNEPISTQTYQGEPVVKIDLLPGTYSLNWAGTQVDNISIRSGEASDVYVGPKGGK